MLVISIFYQFCRNYHANLFAGNTFSKIDLPSFFKKIDKVNVVNFRYFQLQQTESNIEKMTEMYFRLFILYLCLFYGPAVLI